MTPATPARHPETRSQVVFDIFKDEVIVENSSRSVIFRKVYSKEMNI